MNRRERLETVLRGGRGDRVPFTIYKWLLPQTQVASELEKQGLTLIDAAPLCSERTEQVELDRGDISDGGERKTVTRLSTPLGELKEVTRYDPSFGSPWIEKHLLTRPEDFRILQFVLEHTRLEPDFGAFVAQNRELGDRGIVLGAIQPVPVAWMWVQLMGAELWCETLIDRREAFDSLHEVLLRNYRRQVDIAAESPAEFIWLPDNITADMVSPGTFRDYCLPAYEYACATLRQAGKRTFAHYDGNNRPLRSSLAATGIDIIEAFTPKPMGDMTVAEGREAWPEKVLSVNFPGCLFHEKSEVIARHAKQYLEEAGDKPGFVMGCTEDFDTGLFDTAFPAILSAMQDL